MNGRNARRAGIQVLSSLPVATLHGPIGKLNDAAVANGPVSSAGTLARFQHRAFEARFPQLVRGNHSGDASPKNRHSLAASQISWQAAQRCRVPFGQQTESLHGGEPGSVATCDRNLRYETSARHRHSNVPLQA